MGPLKKHNYSAPKYSDYGACLFHLDSCLAPVLSVHSTKIDWTKPKYFTSLCYGHAIAEEVWERVVLNYRVKIVNS